MPQPAERAKFLREELNRHNRLYYVDARPEISDRDYDKLMQELIDLEAAHPELVSPDSPTQRVGGDAIDGFVQVRHAVPMMSIDNTYDEQGVRDFDERIRRLLGAGAQPHYVLEPKIDGTAVSLRYEKGALVLAATRGRGNVGDDITHNARTIKSIPLRLHDGADIPAVVEVRGEIYMNNEDFQRVNKEIEAAGEEPYANPRNLTAGTLKRLDPKVVARRKLRFLSHGLGQVEPCPTDTYWEWIQLIRKWGLPVAQHVQRAQDIDHALEIIRTFATVRGSLPYQTDGMVMKVDAFAQRDKLKTTAKAPRWVIAYKYAAEQQPTVLNGVRWQVGKGGALTPVGDLEPVFIGGVTVTRATLHNIDQIRRLDLHIGDTVVVERAGEVIPYVSGVVADKRPAGAKPVGIPRKCPSCGQPVERDPGTPILRCSNPECPAQTRERLIWFAARTQMNIEGLGEKILNQLIDEGKVTGYGSLFALKPADIADLTRDVQTADKVVQARVGEKNAEKIVKHAEEARKRGLATVLASLSIPHVGATMAQEVARGFKDIDDLLAASESDIRRVVDQVRGGAEKEKDQAAAAVAAKLHETMHSLFGSLAAKEFAETARYLEHVKTEQKLKLGKPQIENLVDRYPDVESLLAASPEQLKDAIIGRVVAHALYTWLHSDYGQRVIKELRAAGVDLSSPSARKPSPAAAAAAANSPFNGKTVVITGGFGAFTRVELKDKLTALGAKVTDSVSGNTDILVVGTDAGSKLDKAKKLGVRTVEEPELLKLLESK